MLVVILDVVLVAVVVAAIVKSYFLFSYLKYIFFEKIKVKIETTMWAINYLKTKLPFNREGVEVDIL